MSDVRARRDDKPGPSSEEAPARGRPVSSDRLRTASLVVGPLVAVAVGVEIGRSGSGSITMPVLAILAGAVCWGIFLRPFIGLLIFVGGISLAGAVPQVLASSAGTAAVGTSSLVLVGAASLGAFLLQGHPRAVMRGFPLAYFAGWAFVVWIFATGGAGALDASGRNQVATYVMLVALLWLVARQLDGERARMYLMIAFCVGASIGAIRVLQEAGIGTSFETSEAGTGFLNNSQSAVYFIVALVFSTHLLGVIKEGLSRLLIFSCAGVCTAAIFATLSRTGLLIFGLGVALLALQRIRRRLAMRIIVVITVVGFAALLVPSGSLKVTVDTLRRSATPHTAVQRIHLWEAGAEMWWSAPIQGIGIGHFGDNLARFSDFRGLSGELVAHSIYISLLAETGLVGFVLYGLVVWGCLGPALHAARARQPESQMAWTWVIALVLFLGAGFSQPLQYDKLLWVLLGGCLSFGYRQPARRDAMPA